ncbi:MAG: penicillin-binding protein [Lachnospiraceae bacterium]|nr:penicillin-binding protein [Lachnospiraceae bacterium]
MLKVQIGNLLVRIRKIHVRILLLSLFFVLLSIVFFYRLFQLQIIRGEEYLNSFQLKIQREVAISPSRGNIYDRNGELLAYNELAYSVVIRDILEESSHKNADLNRIVRETIRIIEENGDQITASFGILLDENGNFVFRNEGTAGLRFLADVFGRLSADDLTYEEQTSTPQDIIDHLCRSFAIGEYMEPGNRQTFVPGFGYEKNELLKVVTIRYQLNLNNYQKYMPATVAFGVSQDTVATIMESGNVLSGVTVEEGAFRRYVDSEYFSQILGYTGQASPEELTALREEDPSYAAGDIVGKSGIESSMELQLQGKKGKKQVYVDNLGRVLEETLLSEPHAGNDVYLTIDKNLQIAAYDLLEKYLSRILLEKIEDIKVYENHENNSTDIVIPIYDVYYALIRNSILDTAHFSAEDAGSTEKEVHAAFLAYREEVFDRMREEISENGTAYEELTKEDQIYQSALVSRLYSDGILMRDAIDTEDEVYQDWTTNETISLKTFLTHAIEKGWISIASLNIEKEYSDSDQVFSALLTAMEEIFFQDKTIEKRLYQNMLLNDVLSGKQMCHLLLEQGKVDVDEAELAQFYSGTESAYTFMLNRISDLDLTPAQLNLDPYSGSMVITDPRTGQVLAMVSYPSFDNNRMSNGVDPVYYESLRNNQSTPLINYATYQETAPGSTFKMVVASAGLCEGVINVGETLYCGGVFDKIGEPEPKCWIYPEGAHGALNVSQAIEHSCNLFFYEVGYRLGLTQSQYQSERGIALLKEYAEMFGLGVPSGVEIEEALPRIATEDAVRASIGQADSGYTTAQLARYVSTVANGGTCYDLTLIDRIADASGLVLTKKDPVIYNVINMNESYWNAIHTGMRNVIRGKTYYQGFPIQIAGKTGTAQQSTDRPNHALFVCYAPYTRPEVAVACRVANGYTSDYAAQITKAVLSYYFHTEELEELMKGENIVLESGTIGGD